MNTKVIKIRKRKPHTHTNEYRFVNESWSKSRSWGHKSSLFINDTFIADNKVTYINRTWEEYCYQSCMWSLIYGYIDNLLDQYIVSYKATNDIKRLTAKVRKQVVKSFEKENVELYKVLSKL